MTGSEKCRTELTLLDEGLDDVLDVATEHAVNGPHDLFEDARRLLGVDPRIFQRGRRLSIVSDVGHEDRVPDLRVRARNTHPGAGQQR